MWDPVGASAEPISDMAAGQACRTRVVGRAPAARERPAEADEARRGCSHRWRRTRRYDHRWRGGVNHRRRRARRDHRSRRRRGGANHWRRAKRGRRNGRRRLRDDIRLRHGNAGGHLRGRRRFRYGLRRGKRRWRKRSRRDRLGRRGWDGPPSGARLAPSGRARGWPSSARAPPAMACRREWRGPRPQAPWRRLA